MQPASKVRKMRADKARQDKPFCRKNRSQTPARNVRGLKLIDHELAPGYVREEEEHDLIPAR